MMGTALAAGVLVAAPVALAKNGADDPPAHVGADDGAARVPASGAGSALSGGGGNRTAVRVAGTCTDSSRAKLKLKPRQRSRRGRVRGGREPQRLALERHPEAQRRPRPQPFRRDPPPQRIVLGRDPHRPRLAAQHGHSRRPPRRHGRGLPGDRHALRSAGPGGRGGAPRGAGPYAPARPSPTSGRGRRTTWQAVAATPIRATTSDTRHAGQPVERHALISATSPAHPRTFAEGEPLTGGSNPRTHRWGHTHGLHVGCPRGLTGGHPAANGPAGGHRALLPHRP